MNTPGLWTTNHPISLEMVAGAGSALWSLRAPLSVFLDALRDRFFSRRGLFGTKTILDDSGDSCYSIVRWLAKCYIALFHLRCSVKGTLILPAGPKILTANHPNATDAFFLPGILPERLYMLVQGNLFDLPILGWLLSRSGQIPVCPDRRAMSFQQACELLRQGRTIFLFPEGKLNRVGGPIQAGTGAVRMSLATGAPIIPIGIHLADKDALCLRHRTKTGMHTGRWQVSGCCIFQFGEAWNPACEVTSAKGKQAARYLTAMLMDKIYTLAQAASEESVASGVGSIESTMRIGVA